VRVAAKVTREVDLEELKRYEQATKDVGERKRLMGIRLKVEGYSVTEIMKIIPVTQCTLLSWVKKFNAKGFDGLRTVKPLGKKRNLNEEQLRIVMDWLDNGPEERHGCCFWTGAKLIEAVKREFGVSYSSSGIYDLLKDLGYRRLVAKTRHHKTDPAAATEFKKNSPQWSRR